MKTLTAFACAILVSSAALAQVHIDVTLGGKTLDVRDAANRAVASYQISPGVPNHPTPNGSFTGIARLHPHGTGRRVCIGASADAEWRRTKE